MSIFPASTAEQPKRGAADAGQYFRTMVDFVGFTLEDVQSIRDSGLVVEKHLPGIVADFYTHLLRYPPTRKHFMRKDGSIDQDYLEKRMHHLTNFWRRTASGVFDDEYASYIDYVGRAHTSHGADPNIYIAERYVIGQVGFIQHAIHNVLTKELHDFDPALELRATRAWNLLLMVILEMLARAYNQEHEGDPSGPLYVVKSEPMRELAVDIYERGLGLTRPAGTREIKAAELNEIPEGGRKIIQVDDLSIGLFHHQGQWIALRNHCLHRGGPVATGRLEEGVLTCPWHGYQYVLTSGAMVVDPASKLEKYEVVSKADGVYLRIPELQPAPVLSDLFESQEAPASLPTALQPHEFWVDAIPQGKTGLVHVNGMEVAVYHVGERFYATSNACTHADGPLNEGDLEGQVITCPWHGSCFDVTSGAVRCGPADAPVRSFHVTVEGKVGRVDIS